MSKKIAYEFVLGLFLILTFVLVNPLSASATFVQDQKFNASDASGGQLFGKSAVISADGTRAIVGASSAIAGGNGAAYIYLRSGDTWIQEQKLTAFDGAAFEQFGGFASITSDGSRVAIGAIAAGGGEGAVYVFSRSGTTWTLEQKLNASDGASDDALGPVSISLDGTRIGVGAYTKNSNQGAVYVFSRSGTTWTEEQKLTASDGATGDFFGIFVVLNSDASRIGIGATSANSGKGAVYVFSRSATTWTQEQKLTASDGTSGDNFGVSLSFSSDASRIAIGANGLNSFQGAAYVFSRSATTWTQEQKLTASDAATGDNFGGPNSTSLSSDATILAVGASGDNSNVGAAYVFSRSATTWTQDQKLTASDGASGDRLGFSSNISGDGELFVAGAVGVSSFAGAAYSFVVDPPPSVSSFSPQDDASDVERESDLTITFSEPVDAETGNIVIKKSSDDSVFETFDVTGDKVTGTGTDTITINPTERLDSNTEYYITIDTTAFDDNVSNSYDGITDNSTWSFTTKRAPSSGGSVGHAVTTITVNPSVADVPSASVCKSGDKFSITTGLPCSTPLPSPTPENPNHCGITIILKVGSRGDQVKCLQQLRNITADGIFGPHTKAAVVDFQQLKALLVDGIVGPQTIKALGL
jgi:peptidoglycan hydrolase-like protein with peptidoglycan-binding domain